MNQKQFFKKYSGYAMTAGARLGIPFQVILAQWAHESAYGTSSLAKRANNFAGIKYNDSADFKSGSYAGYNSFSSFVSDYIDVMSQSYYEEVRKASGINDTLQALGESPYATDPDYAEKIRSILEGHDVTVSGSTSTLGWLHTLANWTIFNPIMWVGGLIYLTLSNWNKGK